MEERFVVGWYRACVGGTAALFALCFLTLSDSREPVVAWGCLALVGVSGILVYGGFRCATLTVAGTGVTIRAVHRTRRLRWDEIESVDFGAGSGAVSGWIVPVFGLVDGRKVRAQEIRSRSEFSIVGQVVECVDKWLDQRAAQDTAL